MAWEARRRRVPPRVAGRVDRSHARRGRDAHRRGKRWTRAAGFGKALQDLLPAPLTGEPERDPAVEIDPVKRNVRRVALRPPRIGQVLLRRVRDGARPQEEGEPARPDDGRFQRPEGELAAWVEHALLDHVIRLQQHCRWDRQAERLRRLEIYDQLELGGLLDRQIGWIGRRLWLSIGPTLGPSRAALM